MKMQRIANALLSLPLCLSMASVVWGGANVSGKVTLSGLAPKPKPISMAAEPGCAKMYATPATTEDAIVGQGGALKNVVVYISAGAPDEATPPSQPIVITQKGCRFTPHVVAMQVNQELQVVNQDSTSHNIHPLPTSNREWNKAQPPGTPAVSESFARPEIIPVKCNIHPWMRTYFAVLKTSHYSVTGDDGTFTLPNLPPGKYTLTAWHETFGTQTQEITITGNEATPIDFVFKAK